MSDTRTEYVGWWHAGHLEPEHEPILDDKSTERHQTDDGLFVFFEDEAEAWDASENDLIIVEVETDVPRDEFDTATLMSGQRLGVELTA